MRGASDDFDLLVDGRALTGGTEQVARLLVELDFRLDEPGPDGVSHRFRSRAGVIDVLAPDGVGARASLTTLPPARTVQVPGGSQGIRRTEWAGIEVANRRRRPPRPELRGAVLSKARAAGGSAA